MATAELSADQAGVSPLSYDRCWPTAGLRPALALRPFYRVWRRTLDRLELSRVELPVRGLSAGLTGTVACQISDLPLDRDEDLERLVKAVEMINAERPDLVFLTGDYFSGTDSMRRYLAPFRDLVGRLNPSVGLFAIAGNHDHWSSLEPISRTLCRAGADLLTNQSRRLKLRAETLVVVGIDDLWSGRAEPARAFSHVRCDDCTIVLAHNPDTALYIRHQRPGVMLSGHTHGGVVRIPLYGSPLRSVLRIGRRFYAGLNPYQDFYIYTNRGLGTFWLRIRFNCRPEVSRFSLRPLAA